MKNFKSLLAILFVLLVFIGCEKKDYSMGDLNAPSDIVINTEIVGQNATNPDGDGSGDVKISLSGKDVLSYKIDYDANNALDLVYLPTAKVTRKYTTLGTNTYTLTVVAYGKGGTSTSVTKTITVKSSFTPPASVVENLTGTGTKSWVVDKSVPGHFGVGPWTGSAGPDWWSAAINEKVACCNCFYTATFKFTKVATSNSYTLQVTSPDGAFTKTGALTTLPGIPGSGDEGCYGYGGGTGNFSFVPAGSGIAASNSTQTSILLGGNTTYIGYGSLQKEYEILQITPTYMYLRVQGTETGNAWYLKLKSL